MGLSSMYKKKAADITAEVWSAVPSATVEVLEISTCSFGNFITSINESGS